MILEEAFKKKMPELVNRKGIVFHHDNARPHTYLATRTKLLELGWEVMSHPPYSPDLAPLDYLLFRSLLNFLNGKNFSNNDDLKSHLAEVFAVFWQRGIMKLPERWQNRSNGMEDIWLITVHFLYRNNSVLFHTKKSKLRSCQPITLYFLSTVTFNDNVILYFLVELPWSVSWFYFRRERQEHFYKFLNRNAIFSTILGTLQFQMKGTYFLKNVSTSSIWRVEKWSIL